ncbi:MAG: hypothetical protein ABR530_08265 [Pyrinomonadaceae bacterium]
MKLVSETRSLKKLSDLKERFKENISDYEARAKSCETCEVQGSCCLDAHFVNVRVSRLEAVAIERVLTSLAPEKRQIVEKRIDDAVTRYGLTVDPTQDRTFACPLFERGTGCLVHNEGKPLPCIAHACYEDQPDLPPENILIEKELAVDALNSRTYGSPQPWLPLPVALLRRIC